MRRWQIVLISMSIAFTVPLTAFSEDLAQTSVSSSKPEDQQEITRKSYLQFEEKLSNFAEQFDRAHTTVIDAEKILNVTFQRDQITPSGKESTASVDASYGLNIHQSFSIHADTRKLPFLGGAAEDATIYRFDDPSAIADHSVLGPNPDLTKCLSQQRLQKTHHIRLDANRLRTGE